MELISSRLRRLVALVCIALLAHGEAALLAQDAPQGAPAEPAAEMLSPDQLDSLVAPIALYPDPLLAQTLVASTYPLELIQLQQWLEKNKDLKDKALADAVAKQPWDPSIQTMAAVPDVVKRLADDIQWTTQLGDAFLDQQDGVMDAVQRMRKKAEGKGALTSNEQQKVETKVVEEKTIIVVQPTNPEVVYVPSYNPDVVYPPPVYPYPPVYYPPYYPGAGLVTFGVGMAMGAAIWGGSCCGCGWGGGNNNININNNNNFNRNTNVNRGGNNNWQHNSQHRGGAPYSNKATANKYGGSARGDTARASSRGGGASAGTRDGAGAGSRGGGAGAGNRGGGASAGTRDAGAGNRGGGAGGGASAGSRGGGGIEREVRRRFQWRLGWLQRQQRPLEQLPRVLEHGLPRWGRRLPGRRRRRKAEVSAMKHWIGSGVVCVLLLAATGDARAQDKSKSAAPAAVSQRSFDTPKAAADALIEASATYDVPALKAILGPDGNSLIETKDPVQSRNQFEGFTAQARASTAVVIDPKNPNLATLSVGDGDWPLPIPIVRKAGKWSFDSKAGKREVLLRRIGRNELDAIEVCHDYVDAQHEYAIVKHDGATVNQYAQKIISTPGKQDGLAWRNAEGTEAGPLSETIADAIAEGYTKKSDPLHGYYFKVLKGQGAAAPLGKIDFVVKGVMIGGFALAAAPSDYLVTGVMTFIVSHDGIVYQKDLGPTTLEIFQKMDRYNPDKTWSVVEEPAESPDTPAKTGS